MSIESEEQLDERRLNRMSNRERHQNDLKILNGLDDSLEKMGVDLDYHFQKLETQLFRPKIEGAEGEVFTVDRLSKLRAMIDELNERRLKLRIELDIMKSFDKYEVG